MGIAPPSGSSEKVERIDAEVVAAVDNAIEHIVVGQVTVGQIEEHGPGDRNVNAADRCRCARRPAPVPRRRHRAVFRRYRLIRWSMICAAREAIRTSRHAGTTTVVNPDPSMRLRLFLHREERCADRLPGKPDDRFGEPCPAGGPAANDHALGQRHQDRIFRSSCSSSVRLMGHPLRGLQNRTIDVRPLRTVHLLLAGAGAQFGPPPK